MTTARRARVLAASLAVASLAFSFVGTGCSSTDPTAAPVAKQGARIIGGATDSSDTFVVGIDIGGAEICSGTLIAPNLVLTARHCVSRTTQTVDCSPTGYYTPKVLQDYPASYFHVTTAQDMNSPSASWWSVSNVYYVDDQSCPNSANVVCDLCGYDLALLELRSSGGNFPNVQLASPAFAPPNVNDSHTSIGYGCQTTESSGCTPVGERMDLDGTAACTAVWGYDIEINGRVCGGDSGGPYYDRASRTVFGALSRGDQDCTIGLYTRVDVHMAWLQAKAQLAAQHGGYAAPAWVSQPAPPQPPPLKGLGETCTANTQCVALDPVLATGNCHRYPGSTERRCSQMCDATNLPCPGGFDCVSGSCWPHSDNPPASTADSGVPADTGVVDDTGVDGDDAGTDPGDAAPGATDQPVTSSSKGGCSLGRSEDRPPRPQPWIVGAAAVALAFVARRRR